MSLPKNYKKGIERVSNIVSFFYPFKGTKDEERYLSWLKDNNINQYEYLSFAQEMGTFIHLQLEKYILGKQLDYSSFLYKENEAEIDYGIEWLCEVGFKEIEPEVYIRDKNNIYQGSCDLLYKDKDNKWVLADWKTFGICKKRYAQLKAKFPDKIPTIATKKRKKVELQMNLYKKAIEEERGIKIDRLELLYLHKNGIKVVTYKPLSNEEISNKLKEYLNSLIPKNINMSFDLPFRVEILEPTKQFGNIKVNLDLDKVDNGRTAKENIDELVKKAKYIANQMK